jgi:hypothetical protein
VSETDMMLARLSDRALRARRLPTWRRRQIARKAARAQRRKEASPPTPRSASRVVLGDILGMGRP